MPNFRRFSCIECDNCPHALRWPDVQLAIVRKLKHIPVVGGMLSEIPILIALVKAYIEKRYLDIPIGSIIAVVGALIYFLSPIDLLPDFLPAIGLADDAAVIGVALKLVHDDVKEYKAWREKGNTTTENEQHS